MHICAFNLFGHIFNMGENEREKHKSGYCMCGYNKRLFHL